MILSGVTNRDEHVSTWPGHVSILMSQFHQFASWAFYAFYGPAAMPFTALWVLTTEHYEFTKKWRLIEEHNNHLFMMKHVLRNVKIEILLLEN